MTQQVKKFNRAKLSEIILELECDSAQTEQLQAINNETMILTQLIDQDQIELAVKFLALGLPKRESIWWAYLCANHAEHNTAELNTQNLLRIAQQWIRDPSEELRRQSHDLAQALELYTPMSWTGMAIFWSGSNIAPKGKPEVQPDYFMSDHAVINAITLSSETDESPHDQLKVYLKQGLHIAMGGNGKID